MLKAPGSGRARRVVPAYPGPGLGARVQQPKLEIRGGRNLDKFGIMIPKQMISLVHNGLLEWRDRARLGSI